MTIKKLVLFFVILLFLFPYANADDYSQHNGVRDSWFYTQMKKIERKIKDRIEEAVNGFFEAPMYELIGKGIGEAFGRKFGDTFSGLVSIGPFLSLDSIIGSSGYSESQVMTKVILRAIHEAKEEIINAIEQESRDATRAMLESLIERVDTYNARDEIGRWNASWELPGMVSDASLIRSRMRVKQGSEIDDFHSYISVSSLQITLEKERTRWLILSNNSDADDEYIEQQVRAVLSVLVANINDYLTQSVISTVDYWRGSLAGEFSDYGVFVRPASQSDVSGMPGGPYLLEGSGIYSYKMAGNPVNFKILVHADDCMARSDDGWYVTRYMSVFDALGEYVGGMRQTHDSRPKDHAENGGCAYHDVEVADIKLNGLFAASGMANGVILNRPFRRLEQISDRHKNNVEALNTYLVDGYLPVKSMIDAWWDMTNLSDRPKSELDVYMESFIEIRPDLNLVYVRESDLVLEPFQKIIRVANIGGDTASSVRVVMRPSHVNSWGFDISTNYTVSIERIDSETGQLYGHQSCSGSCDIGSINSGEAVEILVTVGKNQSGWWLPLPPDPDKLSVRVWTADKEIDMRNNSLLALFE